MWGEFDSQLEAFAWVVHTLPSERAGGPRHPGGRLDFNSFDRQAVDELRIRMRAILSSLALQAYSTIRNEKWREVVAPFAADRLGQRADDLLPRTIAHLALGAALSAYEQWLADDKADLLEILSHSLDLIGSSMDPEATR